MAVEPVISGGNASEMFELVEASLDDISFSIITTIIRDFTLSKASGWNHHTHALRADQIPERPTVIALVGHYGLRLHSFYHGRRTRDVSGVSSSQHEA